MSQTPFRVVLFLVAALAAGASPPPPSTLAQGWQATVAHNADQSLTVVFQPAEWPGVHWRPSGSPWSWEQNSALRFSLTNPGTTAVTFGLRVDDSPQADGNRHSRTATATLGPGATQTYRFELHPTDALATYGMRALPAPPLTLPAETLNGWGTIESRNITAIMLFMHSPAVAQTLVVSPFSLESSPSAAPVKLIDRLGQSRLTRWPGKIETDADFSEAREREEQDLAAHPQLADRDRWGGWQNGPQLAKAEYFRTQKVDGRWWLVTPEGHLFLSWGVDVVIHDGSTMVEPRRELFTELPSGDDPLARYYGRVDQTLYGPYRSGRTFDFYSANLHRKYGPNWVKPWQDTTAKRLVSWGFNTVGNWSDESFEETSGMPFTATLNVWGSFDRIATDQDYWGAMPDPYDTRFALACAERFRATLARFRDNPLCLGYFVDNELPWSTSLVDSIEAADSRLAAKKALVAWLQERYGDVSALKRAWNLEFRSWDQALGPWPKTAGTTAIRKSDTESFLQVFSKQYFTVVSRALKDGDPHHLYLGCRFAGTPPQAVVAAAATVVDVISFNIYLRTVDRSQWDYLEALDRPCLVGEFHFGALDRGLFHAGLGPVADQTARAQALREYLTSVADHPCFVGAHWFQYVDEPTAGRTLDGENYQIGLVSVVDSPYPETVAAARETLSTLYARRAGKRP